MFVSIANDPRPYAWGSTTAIADLLGREASGGPEAELWLGATAGSPARITDPEQVGGCDDLAAWIEADPTAALGVRLREERRLPFLMKVLAAASPLSLQAHPTLEQAVAGFERESCAGVPLAAENRSYKDASHKPELILALSERFDVLCGFRPIEEARELVAGLRRLVAPDVGPRSDLFDPLAAHLAAAASLRGAAAWLLSGSSEVDALVTHLVRLAGHAPGDDAPWCGEALATVRELAREFPGDPGIVVALLMNRVSLRRGEALYLAAGNIHTYVRGLGVEVMASSDNVLRGGLTHKHVDVPELLAVVDFDPLPVPYLEPDEPVPGVRIFRTGVTDFVLVHVDLLAQGVELTLGGPAVVLVTRGEAQLAGRYGSRAVVRGGAVYVTPDEERLHVHGDGELFIATTGGSALDVAASPEAGGRSGRSAEGGVASVAR